jgi:hypothetical protein
MGNTLVVYSVLEHPLRESVSDHLEAFRRYSSRPCIYLNLAVRRVPRALAREQIDMVVFHTTFLSKRGSPDYWRVMLERARPLKEIAAGTRVALPQDEYLPPATSSGSSASTTSSAWPPSPSGRLSTRRWTGSA